MTTTKKKKNNLMVRKLQIYCILIFLIVCSILPIITYNSYFQTTTNHKIEYEINLPTNQPSTLTTTKTKYRINGTRAVVYEMFPNDIPLKITQYYPDGNNIFRIYNFHSNTEIAKLTEYEINEHIRYINNYNLEGEKVETIVYNPDGSILYTHKY